MTFADANFTDDENRGALGEVATGGEVVHQGAIELWQAVEVELLDGFSGPEACAVQPHGEFLLITPGNLVLDQQRQELGIGEFGVDGLSVARLERSRIPDKRSCF